MILHVISVSITVGLMVDPNPHGAASASSPSQCEVLGPPAEEDKVDQSTRS